jgi:hypothetical protein
MSSDEVKAIIMHMDAQHLETVGRFIDVEAKIEAVDAKIEAVKADVDAIAKAVATKWRRDESPC